MGTSPEPKAFVEAIALLAGPLVLLVLLADETDEAWADLYSCAVSIQNVFPRVSVRPLVGALGGAAIVLALVFDVTRYEDFLLLIGAVFVPLFGVLAADYFVVRRGHYAPAALLAATGAGRRRARRPLAGRARLGAGRRRLPLDRGAARAARAGRACPRSGASLPSLGAGAAVAYLAVTRAEPAPRR